MNRDKLRDYFGRVDFTDEIECRELMMEHIRYKTKLHNEICILLLGKIINRKMQ